MKWSKMVWNQKLVQKTDLKLEITKKIHVDSGHLTEMTIEKINFIIVEPIPLLPTFDLKWEARGEDQL